MNDLASKNKTVILIVIIGVLAFAGFYFYKKSGPSTDGALIVSSETNINQEGAEVISIINSLRSIKLDRTIFSDQVFKSLIDFSQPIPPQPKGGRNPFSPISATQEGAIPTASRTTGR